MNPILNATVLACATATLLAGCGGSSGSPEPAPPVVDLNAVPASAYASTSAYSSFARQLASSDSAEPLELAVTAPPTSETDEPSEGP